MDGIRRRRTTAAFRRQIPDTAADDKYVLRELCQREVFVSSFSRWAHSVEVYRLGLVGFRYAVRVNRVCRDRISVWVVAVSVAATDRLVSVIRLN